MEIVGHIADRLADPERVAAVSADPGQVLDPADGGPGAWRPDTLADGFPAVALLFAELGASEADRRAQAHAFLAAALRADAPPRSVSLFSGVTALPFAAHAAALAGGGYAVLLSRLDPVVRGAASEVAAAVARRIRSGGVVGRWHGYDIAFGLSGVGRFLLARWEATGDAQVRATLEEVLAALVAVAVADEVPADGGAHRPAWWVDHDGRLEGYDGPGHLNFGLAHGIAGPLALLALSWRAGVRVAGQADAVHRIVALLDRWSGRDEHGPYWPYWSESPAGPVGPRTREAWCYGAAGIGRALHLAGAALDRPDWQERGCAALDGAIATADADTVVDAGLCHGWAGLLQITTRMARDTGLARYQDAADAVAARVRAAFDPASVFGFRYRSAGTPRLVDRAGFLEGAAGVALALHCHAVGEEPRSGWDAALLIA
jgi:hypothetical protein